MIQRTVSASIATLVFVIASAKSHAQEPVPAPKPAPGSTPRMVIVTPPVVPVAPPPVIAPPPPSPAVAPYVAGLKDNDPGRRVKALYSIAHSGPAARTAVPDMLKILQNETDLSVRRAYFWALQQVDPAAAAAVSRGY